jgi:hypothetical protein
MLARCKTQSWDIEDIDWSRSPRTLNTKVEREVVQYFTDMAQIERFAGALFAEQARRTNDPTLRAIFDSFVEDEERHAVAAERLAKHFNTRRLQPYAPSPTLERFKPKFFDALKWVSAEVANTYILGGELLLDIALLRSIDDFVDDETCHDVMKLINRDESRHVAIDYMMVEYYGSEAHREVEVSAPRRSPADWVRAGSSLLLMMLAAKPFIRDVFVEPMSRIDPERRRMREAWKRMQLLGAKPTVAGRPFARFLAALRFLYTNDATHRVFGSAVERLVGVPGEYLRDLYTHEEWTRASRMSFDELARDALAAKGPERAS